MFSSCNLCLSHPSKWVRTLLQQLKSLNRSVKRSNRRKPKRLFSSFDWITSSFATMEVSNQLKQVFKLIDANGDGKISPLELGEVLLSLGHEKLTAVSEAEGMIRELDCNGDGYIDLDEFMDVVGGPEGGEVGCSSREDELMDAFLMFDSDGNGYISANELQSVFVSLGYDKCSLDECFLMIRGVDKDGDGLVDFQEFRSMMIGCTA
ncbi:probable calcium-binding protein CML18 [Macadamia integrifolia]|uniref:probable calcium-binding protein CML18 n=1 Tax=Macadamia integrifolia TaxID=60698 RepID=UPI001C4F0967|nr:probable calcium-binding protein CML18 [Macadamia integrifolia]